MASFPKIVCILEWVITCLGLLGLIGFEIYMGLSLDTLAAEIHEASPQLPIEAIKQALRMTMIISGVVWGCSVLIEIALNVLLTKGVYQRYFKYLQIWYIIQAILLGFILIGMIISVVGTFRGTESWYTLIGYIISIVYRVWTIKIIRTYINKIKKDAVNGNVNVYQPPTSAR